MEYEKKFLIIGNFNAVTYSDIFPLIKYNKIWSGVSPRSMSFKTPNGETTTVNAKWFTNLDIKKRHEDLILYKKYNKENYIKYDNYNAIEVPKVSEIPTDYDGVIGVPITFLESYNPKQFEILDLSRYIKTDGMSRQFVEDYYASGQKAQISEGHPDLCYYDKTGKPTIPYMRVLIKNKKVVK